MTRKEVSAQGPLERARANGYKQGVHQVEDSIKDSAKYVPKTLKDQNTALRVYEKWLESYPPGQDLSLRKGLPPLDLPTIRDFLRFQAALGQGRLDSRITVDSLNTFTEWFFAGFARVTGNTIDEEDRLAVYKVLPSLAKRRRRSTYADLENG
ncbi:hypothetical protein MMC28_006543 [Mycoblastus sanguinarius]|nr:hypothetical protein [Mycoblastus sanguinarius]